MKSLAIVIVIAFYFAVSNAEMKPEEFSKIVDFCKAANNATEEDVENVMKYRPIDNKASNCMLACINKKIGLMGDDNSISIEKAQNIFQIETLKVSHTQKYKRFMNILEDCKDQALKEADECLIARKFTTCTAMKMETEAV